MSNIFNKLYKFISKEMRMSHVYQPVMLIELLKSGGRSSSRKIAKSLLNEDESQIEYYENITKNMVGKVLTINRRITEKKDDKYLITNFDDLSKKEIKELIELCKLKIDDFTKKKHHCDIIFNNLKVLKFFCII